MSSFSGLDKSCVEEQVLVGCMKIVLSDLISETVEMKEMKEELIEQLLKK